MTEETGQRAYEIVEELRADIDFELDDVISRIVRGLPEDYFISLSRHDQLTQLKALLAMGICNLKEEITLRYDNGRHLAVVSRQNYPGLLAKILQRLPKDATLIGARIFTSVESDFIIDLFEFASEDPSEFDSPIMPAEVEQTVEEVVRATGRTSEDIRKFMAHYPPDNQILRAPKTVAEQFLAFVGIDHSNDIVVRWVALPELEQTRVTISAKRVKAKDVFQMTAAFLADHALDIHQAQLHEIPIGSDSRIAIASFLMSGSNNERGTLDQISNELVRFLRSES